MADLAGAARVAILMGSANDYEVMKRAEQALGELGVGCDVRVISAHRTPERLRSYLATAEAEGIEVLICGAGGAAHLAGAAAALSPLPVLGVPLESSPLKGWDALLSTVQMPPGVPVASFGVGAWGARNAGLFAAQILAGRDPELRRAYEAFRTEQAAKVPERP